MKRIALLGAALLGGCMQYPDPPPITPAPPGGSYRALGTEPFWSLTIDSRSMTFTEANAPGVQVVQPVPPVVVGFAGEIYDTPRIRVNIVHAQCSDGMSDRVYPDKVQVDVDGRRFEGCGGAAVVPASLAGTSWRVESVNGRTMPANPDYFMRFEAATFSSKFGCNGMGGDYRLNGSTLTPGMVAGTVMACPDMTVENLAGAILAAPMTVSFRDGDRMQIANARGTIALLRSY